MNPKDLIYHLFVYWACLMDIHDCNNWMYLGISSLGTFLPYNRFNTYNKNGKNDYSLITNQSIPINSENLRSNPNYDIDFGSYGHMNDRYSDDGHPKEDRKSADKFRNDQQRIISYDGIGNRRTDTHKTTYQNYHGTQGVAMGKERTWPNRPRFTEITEQYPNESSEICKESFKDRLVSRQIQVCQSHPESLVCVSQGAKMAIDECQRQFRNERWNCSAALVQTIPENSYDSQMRQLFQLRNVGRKGGWSRRRRRRKRNGSLETRDLRGRTRAVGYKDYAGERLRVINMLSKTLEKGTKESAFIYATASAAVVHAVTQSCSAGNLTDCSCRMVGEGDKHIYDIQNDAVDKGEWKWGGCSDNVDYGIKFSREFVDAPDTEQIKAILNYYGDSILHRQSLSTSEPPGGSNITSSMVGVVKLSADPESSTKFGPINARSEESKPRFSFPYTKPNKQIVRHLINVHNNEMGREAILTLVQRQCRCHGVSGSCELKTCWLNMPPFPRIGAYIKSKYHESIRVAPKLIMKTTPPYKIEGTDAGVDVGGGGGAISPNSLALRARSTKFNSQSGSTPDAVPIDQLVHMDKSPNYCRTRLESGVFGTQGRSCNATSSGSDGCESLCCGRGYETQLNIREERCHCKFVWCCYVNCNTCKTMEYKHTCK